MKLSASNIAWSEQYDDEVCKYMFDSGFSGLEIAPTRLFANKPYEKLNLAKEFLVSLRKKYNLRISSMQSIWYGKTENIFGSNEERHILIDYTKKAVDFAKVIGCKNLVFGCPKNRIINNDQKLHLAIEFFKNIGQYAANNETIISIEPNPTIYGTNFINSTDQAFELVKEIKMSGIMVNIDLGTIIYNNEDLNIISDNISLVNHIHISEPNLAVIEKRGLHKELVQILKEKAYDKYVSVEMKNMDDVELIKSVIRYVKEVFK